MILPSIHNQIAKTTAPFRIFSLTLFPSHRSLSNVSKHTDDKEPCKMWKQKKKEEKKALFKRKTHYFVFLCKMHNKIEIK